MRQGCTRSAASQLNPVVPAICGGRSFVIEHVEIAGIRIIDHQEHLGFRPEGGIFTGGTCDEALPFSTFNRAGRVDPVSLRGQPQKFWRAHIVTAAE
jgi:hypothetical protein